MTNEFQLPTYSSEVVPDELPEGGVFTYTGEIVSIGFAPTPKWKVEALTKANAAVPEKMFVMIVNPLSVGYDTDKTSWLWEREGNYRVEWVKFLDVKGRIIGPNSPFGVIKEGFRALNYLIRNEEDCKVLRGKKFVFESRPRRYVEDPTAKPVLTDVPVEELPADYKYTGERRIFTRPNEPQSGATRVDPQANREATEKLVEALEGKAKNQFILAVAQVGLSSPYIDEAADGEALIERMKRAGMSWNGEVLTK